MDFGAWRWRRTCTSSPLNTSQRGYADTREHRLRPVGLAMVIRQVSAFLKARNWYLRPTRLTLVLDVPSATSTCTSIRFFATFLYVNSFPGRLQRPGTTPTPGSGRQVWRLRGARRRFSLWCQNRLFFSAVGYAPWDTRPGPRPNFLLRLNRRWTA